MNNIEVKDLFSLLDWSIHGGTIPKVNDSKEFRMLIRQQTVQGIVADFMIEHSDNLEAVMYYREIIARGIRKYHTLMCEQEKICKLLCENGISHAVLKGASVALYYPKPEQRVFGDIDIIVEPERFYDSEMLLLENGFVREKNSNNSRHISFESENKIEIELHRIFSAANNKSQNTILDNKIYKQLSNKINVSCEEYSYVMLPTLENGLVLISHINKHMREGIGIRHLLDWMVYVEHEIDDKMWHNHFKRAVKEIGMETLAITVTKLCKQYLGMSENITWCDVADQQLVDELLFYILRNGNFGRSLVYEKRKTAYTFRSCFNPFVALRQLQSNGIINWKTARKYTILRPFAWVYQILRTIRLGIKRKVSLNNLKNEYKQSRRDIRLLRKLNVIK